MPPLCPLRLLLMVMGSTPAAGAPAVAFGPPRLIVNKSWADGFYGLGAPSHSRAVVGDGMLSTSAGASWGAGPAGCGGTGLSAAFLSSCPGSSRSLCTAMTIYGKFSPQLKSGEQGSNFTASAPVLVEADSAGG